MSYIAYEQLITAILTHLKVHIAPTGVVATIKHVFFFFYI